MILGIDLGTTYSVAACLTEENEIEVIENAEGSKITPSVVLFEDDKITVGEEAKDAGVISSADVIVFTVILFHFISFLTHERGCPYWRDIPHCFSFSKSPSFSYLYPGALIQFLYP